MMKPSESFTEFHTRFLHLAGEAHIPTPDLQSDLFDKLTMELQRTLLPVYSTLTTAKMLADECLVLDQGLCRLKARSDRLKNRSPLPPTPSTRAVAPGTPRNLPAASPDPSSRGTIPERARPVYSDPETQALSNQGACFSCGKKGHFFRDCPQKRRGGASTVQEVETADESEDESGKGKP